MLVSFYGKRKKRRMEMVNLVKGEDRLRCVFSYEVLKIPVLVTPLHFDCVPSKRNYFQYRM